VRQQLRALGLVELPDLGEHLALQNMAEDMEVKV
jgi:hypothetical protein